MTRRVQNTSKKGQAFVHALIAEAQPRGFPFADRPHLQGAYAPDQGDAWLCLGVLVQAKDQPTVYVPNLQPTKWLEATERQRIAAGAAIGLLVVKPKAIGLSRVDLAHVWLPAHTLAELLVPTGDRHPDPRHNAIDHQAPNPYVRTTYGEILDLLLFAEWGAEERWRAAEEMAA